MSDDVNDRLWRNEPRGRKFLQDNFTASDEGTHQDAFQFVPSSLFERIERPDVAARPRKKADLVHGREHVAYTRISVRVPGHSPGEAPESGHKRRPEDVQSIRPAEVQEVQ